MDVLEQLVSAAMGDGKTSAVIRPAAVVAEQAARAILASLDERDVRAGGRWHAEPTRWQLFDRAWEPTGSEFEVTTLLGTVQVIYGVPTRYEITVYRVTITSAGETAGWTVQSLCDAALSFGGLTLATCPRADLHAPPLPFPRRPAGCDRVRRVSITADDTGRERRNPWPVVQPSALPRPAHPVAAASAPR